MPRWPERDAPTPREAAALQERWRSRVVRVAPARAARPELVLGVDVGVQDDVATAAVCLLRLRPGARELEPVEEAVHSEPVRFPYVPGLLGFREVPCILAACAKLAREPDVCLVDGHGEAHPRRFGVATHLGLELGLPTVGVGKQRLVGAFREPGPRRGAATRLVGDRKGLEGQLLGKVVRTREAVAPVFVSIGHLMDLETAVRLTLRCATRYRLPDPIRAAHQAAYRVGQGLR